MSKGLEELGLELIQLERVWARLGPCGDADGLKGSMAKFSCLFLAPDELPALIRTAEGAWGDQQGYQVGEDPTKNLKMGMYRKHKVQPKSPGTLEHHSRQCWASRWGPWNPSKANVGEKVGYPGAAACPMVLPHLRLLCSRSPPLAPSSRAPASHCHSWLDQ